jgi:hypothetical protein
VAGGLSFTHSSFGSLPGDSHFLNDYFPIPPCIPEAECERTGEDPGDDDFAGRVALVFDSRDNETVPARGVLAEVGAEYGSGGQGYGGIYGLVSGFVSPYEGAVIGARFLARSIQGEAPLDARYTLYAWERSVPLLGGPESHRSFVYGRFTGRQALVTNLEYRQDILNFGDFGAISALGFFDAGLGSRERGGVEQAAYRRGGGLALRILRSTVCSSISRVDQTGSCSRWGRAGRSRKSRVTSRESRDSIGVVFRAPLPTSVVPNPHIRAADLLFKDDNVSVDPARLASSSDNIQNHLRSNPFLIYEVAHRA